MFGLVPRRIKVADLEVVLTSMGYRVAKEPFQVVGFKQLGQKQRLHLKVGTYGGSAVPKDAPMDLHIDTLTNPMKFHGSIAHDEKIGHELEAIEEAISTADQRVKGGDAIAFCSVCGKEMAGRFLRNHMKMHHPERKVRTG